MGIASLLAVIAMFASAVAAYAAATNLENVAVPKRSAETFRFSGNGGKALSPFRLSSESTMTWTNTGEIFQIFNSGASSNGTVNASSRRGTTYMPAGRYRLQVNALGSWTVTIRSGVERIRRVGGAIIFSGNGGKALPPFRVPRDSTLNWTNSGSIFQIFNNALSNDGTVNSQGRKGNTFLPSGTYRLQVNAIGNWTIRIR